MHRRPETQTHIGLLAEAGQAARRLLLFRGVLRDPIGQALVALLDAARAAASEPERMMAAYADLFALLADAVELGDGPLVGDPLQDHLLARVLIDDNPFSRKAQRAPGALGGALMEAARHDLAALQTMAGLTADRLTAALREVTGDDLTPWSGLTPLREARPVELVAAMRELAATPEWGDAAPRLAAYYARAGSGIFALHRAFRWEAGEEGGRLVGIATPDPIRLDDLVGYERERQPILENTEHFLAGFRANNVLLYGDRGTGKSSTIKALLNEHGERGLRLIEAPRRSLHQLSAIMAAARGRLERFIIFVDDLSFAEVEDRHLDLKVLLEGGLEHHPDNVVVYVTSNRRHLVREFFTPDRGLLTPDGEIRPGETVQESLSLADRFGLVVTFLAPTQERYLTIVAALAEQRGLRIDPERLRQRALQWSSRHNGLSGRTARQFIDHLAGEAGLASAAGPA